MRNLGGVRPVRFDCEWLALSLTPNPRQHYQSPMINLTDLTTGQLHRIIAIKEQIEALKGQIDSLAIGGGETPSPIALKVPKKHLMSTAARAGSRSRGRFAFHWWYRTNNRRRRTANSWYFQPDWKNLR